MSITKALGAALFWALLLAATASAAGTATITISHQMRGCHMWQLGNGTAKANLSLTLKSGTVLRFVNNDIMRHKLIQQAGPKLRLTHPGMNRLSATTRVELVSRGAYRFTTRPGEDYKIFASHHTIGEDYVLHLTVRVK